MKEKDILGTSDSKSKVLESAQLTIKGNGIVFEDTVIQISNITQIWAGDIPKKALPLMPVVVGGLVGVIALLQGITARSGGGMYVFIGMIILAVVGYVVWQNRSQTQYYAVNIELSSSRLYSFTSPQRSFIDEAFKVLNNIICDEIKTKQYINFGNGTIMGDVYDSTIQR